MLRHPVLDKAFETNLMWFVGCFCVYDREETLGATLAAYNPNSKIDREYLIKKYSLSLRYFSHRHKYVTMKFLDEALADPSYDFAAPFNIDEDEHSSWPRAEWYELDNPREFFEDVYRLAAIEWKHDLEKASLEDQSKW